MSDFIIDIFLPPDFKEENFDVLNINEYLGRSFQYASLGRYAFYHILKSYKIKGKILIPAYICKSVLEPLRLLKIEPVFYDIDIRDLNASVESIEFLGKKYKVSAVLIASMYGNAADLIQIEYLCRKNKWKLIDDAAQSIGAVLDKKFIGSFGDAGFFSLSPGKPAAGHMGAFFWTQNDKYIIKRKNHDWYHQIAYLDFYYNRIKIYDKKNIFMKKTIRLAKDIMNLVIDIKDDKMAECEKKIIGGILKANFEKKYDFRNKYTKIFLERFSSNPYFCLVRSIRGIPNNHKFILVANSKEIAINFIYYLKQNKIFSLNGYSLLTNDLDLLPNANFIKDKVIEIPIENDLKKMNYLFDVIEKFGD